MWNNQKQQKLFSLMSNLQTWYLWIGISQSVFSTYVVMFAVSSDQLPG